MSTHHSRPEHLVAGLNLATEAGTADTVRLLREFSVEPIVIKGPNLVKLLYGTASGRASHDIDVLVSPGDVEMARAALSSAGKRPRELVTPGVDLEHAEPWLSGDGPTVDLHWSIAGASRPADLWNALRGTAVKAQALDTEILVPGNQATCLLLALHAAQHGARVHAAIDDLDRGIERFPESSWFGAASLARRAGAETAFSSGLRLVPAGSDLARRLGVVAAVTLRDELRAASPPPTSEGVLRLAEAATLRERLRFLRHKLVPPRAFMRDWIPLAQRGPAGLAASYAYRIAWLARWCGPGYVAWRRARKLTRPGA